MLKSLIATDEEIAHDLNGELIADGLIKVVTDSSAVSKTRPSCANLVEVDLEPMLGERTSFDSLLAIDTETTGLSGGSGTVAFNIGCAYLRGGEVEVTQYVLTKYSGEKAMLDELSALVSQCEALVTYNGKSFDVPLLVTRFRMQRKRAPFIGLPHIDLLHPTRALFGKRWRDCRLTTVEREALGFERQDDLPGFLVPAAWADFLKTRDATHLGPVIEHNRNDVVSLLALMAKHARIHAGEVDPDVDALALSRVFKRRGQRAKSLQLLESQRHRLSPKGELELARELKHHGRVVDAIEIWSRLAETSVPEAIEYCAKYHEHTSKDIVAALRYADALIATCGRRTPHLHRKERLSRKLTSW